jgi:hypothetical protein
VCVCVAAPAAVTVTEHDVGQGGQDAPDKLM